MTSGGRVLRERRVARGTRLPRLADGDYFARFTMRRDGKRFDVRRLTLRVRGGRAVQRPDHHRRDSCGLLRSFKLERPVFGGTNRVPLRLAYKLSSAARVEVIVRRGGKVVRRFAARRAPAGRTVRLTLPLRGLRTGDHRVTLEAGGITATLVSRNIARRGR